VVASRAPEAPERRPALRRGDRSVLRRPAVLLAVPCAFLAYLLLDLTPTVPNYGLSRASAANGTLVFVGPFVAVCAAYEAFTLRSIWGRLTVVRPWWQVLGERMIPVVAAGLAVMGVIYAIALAGPGGLAAPGWQFPLLSLLGIVTWTSLGAAVALVAGRLVAMSVALLLPFLVLALPAGWEPLWVRHVNGMLIDCCSTSQIVDPRALTASVGFLGGLLVLSVCVARVRLAPPQHTPWLAGVVALLTLAGAVVLVSGAREMTASPAIPRSQADLHCQEEICLWPEDREALAVNRSAWQRVRQAWIGLGLPEPTGHIGPVAAEGILPVTSRAPREQDVVTSMALTLPRAMLGCTADFDNEQQDLLFEAVSYLLLIELDVPDPEEMVVVVSSPPPQAADATNLWQGLERCQ
jgi:hypothetical protein